MSATTTLLYRFLGVDAGAGAQFDRMGAKTAGLSKSSLISKQALLGLTKATVLAGGVVAAESVHMAASFQTAMMRIHTQANQSTQTVAKLSDGVLKMAGSVASTPQALADAAYHIASVGQHSLTTGQQLNVLRIASEGAKIGGANLTDVTNALDAAIVSGIKGAGNYSQAMGVLNATVGAGDMRMQDLADAFGPLGAVLKGYNVSLRETGAALATFGDNNVRGEHAGTALRMAVQSLVAPVKKGAEQLRQWGISSGSLANAMQHGGLTQALDVLMKKMREHGVTAKEQGDILTQAFGKRAGIGLSILEGELGRFHTKLKEVSAGATGFGSSWAGYTKTFGYNLDSARAAAESLMIQLGDKLLPVATSLMGFIARTAIPALSSFGHWLAQNAEWTKPLAIALGAVALALTMPITASIALGVALVVLYNRSETFRHAVQDMGAAAVTTWNGMRDVGLAVWHALDAAWQAFANGPLAYLRARFADFAAFWHSHSEQIRQVTSAVWGEVSAIVRMQITVIVAIIRPFLTFIASGFRTTWHLASNLVLTSFHLMLGVFKLFEKVLLDVVGLVLDIITGKWGKAWSDAKKLVHDAITGVGNILKTFAHDALKLLVQAGKDIIQGLVNGMKSLAHVPLDIVKGIGHGIAGAAKSVLKIFSPSQVFHEIGQNVVKGLANGIAQGASTTYALAKRLAQGIIDGWNGQAQRVHDALTKPMKSALKDMTATVTSELSKQRQAIQTAMSRLKSDLSKLKSDQQKYASDLKQRASDVANLAGNIASPAGLAGAFSTDANGVTTLGNVASFVGGNVGALKQFADDLKKAKSLGLNQTDLSQIAQMGAAQGDQILQQLISGQSSSFGGEINQLNSYQEMIDQYTKQAASVVVDPTYAKQLAGDKKAISRDEKAVAKEREEVKDQTQTLHRIEKLLQHLKEVSGSHVTFTGPVYGTKSEELAKEIQRLLNQMVRRNGKVLATGK